MLFRGSELLLNLFARGALWPRSDVRTVSGGTRVFYGTRGWFRRRTGLGLFVFHEGLEPLFGAFRVVKIGIRRRRSLNGVLGRRRARLLLQRIGLASLHLGDLFCCRREIADGFRGSLLELAVVAVH